MSHVILAPGTVRGPHWHDEANELIFCLSGTVQVSIWGEGNGNESVVVALGAMLHVACGALQMIENVGDSFAELMVVTDVAQLGDNALLHVFVAMSAIKLTDRVSLQEANCRISRSGPPSMGGKTPMKGSIGESCDRLFADEADRWHFAGCGIRPIRPDITFLLKSLSLCAPGETRGGSYAARPHPGHVAMAYLHAGQARLSVLDARGLVETSEIDPARWKAFSRPCHERETWTAGIHAPRFIIFDQPMLADMGYRSATCLLTGAMLSAMGGMEKGAFHVSPCNRLEKSVIRWIDAKERPQENSR